MRNIAVSIIILMIFFVSSAAAELVSGIAVVVNDEIITILELNREYSLALKEEEKRGVVLPEAAKKLRRDILDSLIDRKLVRQKIKELNINISEEEVRQSIEEVKKQNKLSQEALVSALLSQGMTFDQYKSQMKEQLERLRLMGQEVKSNVQVHEKDIKDYYDANLASFTDEETYHASAIFLRLADAAIPEEVRAILLKLEVVSRAAKKGTDFAALARKYSNDANAQTDGGDLGTFKKGEMLPEIEKIVLSIKPGEVDTIAAPGGFYIIKLVEKRPGPVKPFEAVKGQIEDKVYQKKTEERFTQWLKELRKGAAIDIKELTIISQ